jgi:hypothetical protein
MWSGKHVLPEHHIESPARNPPIMLAVLKYMSEVPGSLTSLYPLSWCYKHRLMSNPARAEWHFLSTAPPFPDPRLYFAPSCLRETRIQLLKGVIDNGTTGYAHKIKVENHTLESNYSSCASFSWDEHHADTHKEKRKI